MELTGDMAPKCLFKWTAKGNLRVRFGFSKIKGSRVYLQSIWMKPDNKELMTQNSGLLRCPAFVIAMCNSPVVFNLFLDTDASLNSACLNRVWCALWFFLRRPGLQVLPLNRHFPGCGCRIGLLRDGSGVLGWASCSLAGNQLLTFSWKCFSFVFSNVFPFKLKIFL